MSDEMMNVRDTARALGVHENTIRNWADDGLIPVGHLPSGTRRFKREDVERMRREMFESYAPAEEMPAHARTDVKRGQG